MRYKLFVLLLLLAFGAKSQEEKPIEEEIRINEFVTGTLIQPPGVENPDLVLFIAGSGPTDRNGNQSFMKNDSFKKLARDLAGAGFASFRYDKRVLQAGKLGIAEKDMRFDDFVVDVGTILDYFQKQGNFRKLILLGHSQGSLVGMLAGKEKADALISIAGAGRPIDSIIVDQIAQQMPALRESSQTAFSEMRKNGSTSSYNPILEAVFRPSVQPFLLSWMLHDPVTAIADLEIPVLLINGTNDFQVPESEAQLLKEAHPEAKLVLLEDMNHVLVKIEGSDTLTNSKSYNEPALPLHPGLVSIIADFIRELK